MKFDSRMVFGTALVLGVLTTGCVTHPLSEMTTAYDRQTYDSSKDRKIPTGAYTIAIASKGGVKSPLIEKCYVKSITEAAESAAVSKLGGLGWFKVVDRKNASGIASENLLNGGDGNVATAADLLLVIDSQYTLIHKEKMRECNQARDAGGIVITSDMRLDQCASGKPLLAESFTAKSPLSKKSSNVRSFVAPTVADNIDSFAKLLVSRFLPGAEVVETRGMGKVARVRMGKNYNLKPGSKVEFFTDSQMADGSFDRRVFATGTVLEDGLEAKQCWVEVDNFKAANVHVGNRVKVQE